MALGDNPAPRYPPLSRRMGEQGRVLLRVHVSTGGSAMEVALHKTSGFDRLDRAGNCVRTGAQNGGGSRVGRSGAIQMPLNALG